VIAAEPEPPAAKRRKIAETKENLRDRVKQLERTEEQQRTRIQQLEDELASLKKAHAMENYNRIMRERKSQREE
jgi:predicted  nucleic acid-binding Zn-ribbon protein